LSFSQSRYPLQTVINGDSVVILTKGQADTINTIFESQKIKINELKEQVMFRDSIISIKNSLYTEDYNELVTRYLSILFFLNIIENDSQEKDPIVKPKKPKLNIFKS
jgi:hypothetical protein